MDRVQQRVKFTTTLPIKTKEILENIREKNGFSSISMAIEWLTMNYSMNKRIDTLISVIEKKNTYKESTAERKVTKTYLEPNDAGF